jgi:twinkle protein
MTQWTYGRRMGETHLWGAGTGLGKSDYLAEVIAADLQGRTKEGVRYEPQPWGVFSFETGAVRFKKIIAGKIAQRRFHIPHPAPDDPDGVDPGWTQEELTETLARMDTELWDQGAQLYINDSFGMADFDAIVERVRFLSVAHGVKHFLIDPIGACVTGSDDERKDLDEYALRWAKLMVELDCYGYMVSHLTRPSQGPSHEEGGQVSGKQFRGSNGLIMYSWWIFGLERNQQADNEADRVKTTVRVVKDRPTGNSTGQTHNLFYDRLNGTLDTMNLGDNP